jgi:hypothetical protein
MKHSTYDTQTPKPVRRELRDVLNKGCIVHSLRKTRQNGVTIFELVSSDVDGQRFKFSTFYTHDTGEKRETHFTLSGRELIRFAAIAADLDDTRMENL